jgi:Zn ribbon nucleic-acid-binding protein
VGERSGGAAVIPVIQCVLCGHCDTSQDRMVGHVMAEHWQAVEMAVDTAEIINQGELW